MDWANIPGIDSTILLFENRQRHRITLLSLILICFGASFTTRSLLKRPEWQTDG